MAEAAAGVLALWLLLAGIWKSLELLWHLPQTIRKLLRRLREEKEELPDLKKSINKKWKKKDDHI